MWYCLLRGEVLGQLRLFGGLCEVEDEVVRVGSKLRVRWMVVSGFGGGGMEKEGKGTG